MAWILLLLAIGLAMSGKSTDTPTAPTTPTELPEKPIPPKKPSASPVAGAPSTAPAATVPQKLSDYFLQPGASDVGATLAGWYTYAGRWIRVEEYVASKDVAQTGLAAAATKVWYEGRFRWAVMMVDGSTPLALGTTDEVGEALAFGFDDPEKLVAEARNEAIDEAAKRAAEWIDAFDGKD